MNILFYRYFQPYSHVHFYENALRRSHQVITAGIGLTEDDAKKYEMQDLVHLTGKTDIPRFSDNLSDIKKAINSKGIRIDMLFYTDVLSYLSLDGFYDIDCPTVCFILDPQVFTDFKIAIAHHFDYVFISQKVFLEEFKKSSLENVFWLPHACDIDTHGKRQIHKLYDIGFVGNPLGYRLEVLNKLKDSFNVYYERVFGRRMSEVFSASKMVLNFLSYGEINMRVFEAMASGSLLLTPYAPISNIDELFEDKKHLVFYKDEHELKSIIQYYLDNENEREQIARQGMNEVIDKHTYDIRLSQILYTIQSHSTPLRDRKKHEYFHSLYKGMCSILCGNYKDAKESIKRALEIDNYKKFAYNIMGLYYRKTGDIKKAIYCITKAIEIDSNYYDAYVNLACAFSEINENEKNIETMKIASRLRPFNICHEYIL